MLQRLAVARWHNASLPALETRSRLEELILAQHEANTELWHREDAARDPLASDVSIASCKRSIDELNQLRNDLVEKIDRLLLEAAGAQNPEAPLQSETPGLMIDRLSILALKIFHTGEEARRRTADELHRQRNERRLAILEEQLADLSLCLDQVWSGILHGSCRFKLYQQLKMYNDPELNPVLYGRAATGFPEMDKPAKTGGTQSREGGRTQKD